MTQLEQADDAQNPAGVASKPSSQTSANEHVATKKLNEGGDEGKPQDDEDEGEEEEEEDDDEEYEIEAIIDYQRSYFRKGENAYLVKWKGYGEDQNSWVAEEDAGNAKELITEFLKQRAKSKEQSAKQSARGRKPNSAKISKSGKDATPDTESVSVSTTKRGRGKAASSIDSDEEQSRTTKKTRVNTTTNGSASAKRVPLADLGGSDDEDVPMVDAGTTTHDGRPYTSMKALKMAGRKSWEDAVKTVVTVERGEKDLLIYFETTTGDYVREPSKICRVKFPQKLFDFYESHLRWRVANEDSD